jgi:peptidylprolyl isomerase
MKHSFLFATLLLTASAAGSAQTSPKPVTTPKAANASVTVATKGLKLPPGIPRARGVVKTAFSLRYQDVKIGTGAEAEPNKMYKVLYTGWLAADGHEFDSSEDHRLPLKDKDGKPVMGDDGKAKLGDPQPFGFAQGFGRVIPGFDQGFTGMKIGGKRRLFIPWQLAYGARGRPGPDPAHPGIPPKSDLIFDIELVDVADLQMPPNHPGMPGGTPIRPGMTIPPGHPPLNPKAPVGSGAGTNSTPSASPGTPAETPPTAKPATPAPGPQTTTTPQPQSH